MTTISDIMLASIKVHGEQYILDDLTACATAIVEKDHYTIYKFVDMSYVVRFHKCNNIKKGFRNVTL